MAEIESIKIQNYKSIKNLELILPKNKPVALIGENNAGKTNILKAIHLILGERYPGNFSPQVNDFFKRQEKDIKISVNFSENLGASNFNKLVLKHDVDNSKTELIATIGSTGEETKYINNSDRNKLNSVYIDAEKNLTYQLSYKSKYTFLSKLMRKFHGEIKQDEELYSELKDNFAKTKELFRKVERFADFREQLRGDFDDFTASMPHSLEVDFEAFDPTNFFHALQLQPVENEEVRAFGEIGSGEKQVLSLSFIYAYAKSFHEDVLLLIEEPESNLHPLAQHFLSEKLKNIAKKDKVQVIFSTHNASFINLLNVEGLSSVFKNDEEETEIKQLDRDNLVDYCKDRGAKKATADNIAEFYANHSTKRIKEGFFASKIILVEGPSESFSLPIYLKKIGLDIYKKSIDVISAEGKDNIAKWVRIFSAYNISVYVIFDNDNEDDKKCEKRKNILNSLNLANFSEDVFEEDSFVIKDKYAVFGLDFEKTFRSLFPKYREKEKEAIEKGIRGKKFIAKYAASNIDKSNEKGWKKIEQLKEKIVSLNYQPEDIEDKYDSNNEGDLEIDPEDIPF